MKQIIISTTIAVITMVFCSC